MGTRASQRGLSYQVKSREVAGGQYRPFACAACHVCETNKEIRLNQPNNNPELIQQKFRAEGWDFDAWNTRGVTCPDCLRKRREGRHGDSGKKGGNILTLHTTQRPPVASVAVAASQGGARLPDKTELTVPERARVRDILIGTFDEKAGQYSEGWSDARVAKEAGDLPIKLIADLRDVAFGPLRSIVELEPLKVEMVDLDKRLREHQRQGAALAEDFGRVRQRLDETAQRLGVKP